MSTGKISTEQLIKQLTQYELSEEAYEYALKALSSEPSREVGQYARNNVTGAYSSFSQGLTLQYESHTAELAWLIRWEMDENVLGCRDQPPMVEFRKPDKNGVQRNTRYTPDFIVFKRDSLSIIEVKTESELHILSGKFPEQWVNDSGAWVYRPAEKYFNSIGLMHTVRSDGGITSIESNNIKTFIQVRRSGHRIPKSVQAKVLSILREKAWLSLSELQKSVPESSIVDLHLLVLHRVIYADIKRHLLTEISSCIVSLTPDLLDVYRNQESAAPETVQSMSVHAVPDKLELEKALERLDRIHSEDSSRHARRLRKRVAVMEAMGLTPLQALTMPRSGNTRAKISEIVRQHLEVHIRSHYMTKLRPSVHGAWTHYRNSAREEHPTLSPVSIKTYRRYIEKESAEAVAFARGGKRAGNAAALPTAVEHRELKATRPFERASIDHTLLKILAVVVESNGETYVRKPWLTALVDDYSGYWLSFFLSFSAPSKRSLAMLFRHCVREHSRLPEMVHSDRGADLRSVYYRGLLAHYQVTADWSPAGHSRFNSQVERLNKQIKDQWISRRPGNTIDYKNTRKFSKGHRPQDLAQLKLEDLFREIETYRQLFNNTVIGNESVQPSRLFQDGIDTFSYSGIPVEVDDKFLLVTAYDTNHSEYKISTSGEIVFGGLHFTHPDLRLLRPKRARTELRVDPEDPYRLYCKVEDNWVTALSSNYKKFQSRSMHERWAEALRVGEGRPLRDEAKQHSHDLKAKKITSIEQSYLEEAEPDIEIPEAQTPELYQARESIDLFERLKIKTQAETDTEVG